MITDAMWQELLASAVLGIIQGLTEFLPVSSSAHLILFPWLLGWDPEGLTFDVAVHFGTSLAVLSFFWKDWLELGRAFLAGLRQGDFVQDAQRRLGWYLIIATVPAALVGFYLQDYIEEQLRSPIVTVVTLIVFGGVLYYSEHKGSQSRSLEDATLADGIWIGLVQALALVPGVSRSGITISMALFRDIDRTSAARFSFLLSTPIVVGASLLKGIELLSATSAERSVASGSVSVLVLLTGITFSAITGFLCIRYFLRYLRSGSFTPFVLYRIGLALTVWTIYAGV